MLSYPPMDGAAPAASLDDDEEALEDGHYLGYCGDEGSTVTGDFKVSMSWKFQPL